MKRDLLIESVLEAKRFIKAAEKAVHRLDTGPQIPEGKGTRETAAARRASLDLSHVLAQLRRPG